MKRTIAVLAFAVAVLLAYSGIRLLGERRRSSGVETGQPVTSTAPPPAVAPAPGAGAAPTDSSQAPALVPPDREGAQRLTTDAGQPSATATVDAGALPAQDSAQRPEAPAEVAAAAAPGQPPRSGDAPPVASPPTAPAHTAPPPDVEAPSVPSSFSARATSETEVLLTWSASHDNVGPPAYEVTGPSQSITTPAVTVTVHGLSAWTDYCFRVRAVDAAGNRSAATAPVCTRTLDTTPPTSPRAVTARAPATGGLVLSWEPSTDNIGVARYDVMRSGRLAGTVKETELALPELESYTEYCHYIRAVDAAGNASDLGEPICARTADTKAPSTPVVTDVHPLDEHRIALTWNASSDDDAVEEYAVDLGAATPVIARTPSTLISGFSPAQQYCFTVRAIDRSRNVSTPSARACATTPDLTPPTAPDGVVATATRDGGIQLAWAQSRDDVGVAGYDVMRGTQVVAQTQHPRQLLHDFKAGVRYCYTIRAWDAARNLSGESREACAVPLDVTPPTAPLEPAATAGSSRSVVVGWQPSKDDVAVTGYEVLRDDTIVATGATTYATAHGLNPLQEYCFAVQAHDAAGNRSPRSARVCAKTLDPATPSTPRALRAHAVSATAVALKWEPSQDRGVVYRIYESAGIVGATSNTEFVAVVPTSASRRCYRVTAIDKIGRESPSTLEVCAKAPDEAAETHQ